MADPIEEFFAARDALLTERRKLVDRIKIIDEALASASRTEAAAVQPNLDAVVFTPLSTVEARPTRDFVYQCIQTAAPGRHFDDATVLQTLGLRTDDLGTCLNTQIPLQGSARWRGGQIKPSWTVSILITRTDARRNRA